MSGKPCIFYSDAFLKHGGDDHIEAPSRAARTMARLEDAGLLERADLLKPAPARDEDILAVHTPEYLAYLRAKGRGYSTPTPS